jgi:hypothetical protein
MKAIFENDKLTLNAETKEEDDFFVDFWWKITVPLMPNIGKWELTTTKNCLTFQKLNKE